MKLLELVKRVPYAKVEIDVDAKFEAEPDEDDDQAGMPQAAPSQIADAAPVAVPVGNTASPAGGGPTGPGTQQNIPPGATNQGGPLSITKRYDPDNASREEVVQALTNYLNKELALQGTRELAVNDDVRWAVLKLFKDNPDGYGWFESQIVQGRVAGDPADLAAMVGTHLPDFIPRKNMSHLDMPPAKDQGPTTVGGKAKVTAKEKLGEIGKIPEEVGNPNGPVEAPSNNQRWDPAQGSTPSRRRTSRSAGRPRVPKPNLPQAPPVREQQAVNKVVQSLDDNALVPAAMKGKPEATNFASAKELARDIADRLAPRRPTRKTLSR